MGSLKGDSKKTREAFGKYKPLENPLTVQIEELSERMQVVIERRETHTSKRDKLGEIDHQEVTYEDEDYIAERYREFGEEFVPPKIQGLKEALPKEKVSYNIDWGKVGGVELTKSVDGRQLQAALEATYGVHVMGDVAFESEFGVAKADFEAFLGAVGKASLSTSYDWDGIVLEAVADFFAGARLTCNGELRAGTVENNLKAKLSGKAIVGIEGVGNAKLSLKPGQLSAALKLAAFAGAKAQATGAFSATVFGREIFTHSLTATASVGIGATLDAHVDVGVQKIGFGFEADLTVGLGAGTGMTTQLDVLNIVMSFAEAKDGILHARRYLEGYRNLGLQDEEWRRKIKALTDKYDVLIREETQQIEEYRREIETISKQL